MSPKRRAHGVSRRKVLMGLGAGLFGTGAVAVSGGTVAFSSIEGNRTANVSIADDPGNAILGMVDHGPVQKNQQEEMAEFTNNSSADMTLTVTLDNAGDGTLYDNEGGSGSSVTFDLAVGNSQIIDIEADVTGTITYSVTATSSELDIETSGSVESESGNVKGAVVVKKPDKDQDFTANQAQNQFEVKDVDVRDNDGDDDLDKIEFRVKEGGAGGIVVGSMDVDDPPGDRYSPNGNPAVTIDPDSGYSIKSNTTYALTVKGYDVDGNFDSATVEDTT